MSAALPPVPDLIPISALRNKSVDLACTVSQQHHQVKCSNNNDLKVFDNNKVCTPRNSTQCPEEVMGEQRSRRRKGQVVTGVETSIDTSRSRDIDGTAPREVAGYASRKTRAERHRKSDRRRVRGDRRGSRRSASSTTIKPSASPSALSESPDRPANPRVNPIFVWVRQQDTHIVEVKCEDYDKRNRILLTKTAQGWRAIPRTETLVPSLQKLDDTSSSGYSDKSQTQAKPRKIKKRTSSKVKRKSLGIQVDEVDLDEQAGEPPGEPEIHEWPSWSETEPINVESHLPSHTILTSEATKVRSTTSIPDEKSTDNVSNVNSDSDAHDSQHMQCNIKTTDVSPLDNLLAVAELEFNQQIQAEQDWNKTNPCEKEKVKHCEKEFIEEIKDVEEFCAELKVEEIEDSYDDMDQLDMFIESCAPDKSPQDINEDHTFDQTTRTPKSSKDGNDIDYVEDDENNLAIVAILNRLEESLQSPSDALSNCDINNIFKRCSEEQVASQETARNNTSQNKMNDKINETTKDDDFCEIIELAEKRIKIEDDFCEEVVQEDVQETATDLSTSKRKFVFSNNLVEELLPTDLSIRRVSPPLKRPQSQNSETIQSPQPSGIPAIPPSPELCNSAKNKSNLYLESLLSPVKDTGVSENVPENNKPLDLGKSRESDSPKVTCSQEVQSNEPPPKKIKLEPITLKTLLDNETHKKTTQVDTNNKVVESKLTETPRLLELLTNETQQADPITQLNQVLCNTSFRIPNPLLIPKHRLSQILLHPAKEIPRLLAERPELKLPEALQYPHLLQDPDMLVITLEQLSDIILKQSFKHEDPIVQSSAQSPVQSTVQTPVSNPIPSGVQTTVQTAVPSSVQSIVQSVVQSAVQSSVQSSLQITAKSIEPKTVEAVQIQNTDSIKNVDTVRNTESVKISSSTPTKQTAKELRETESVKYNAKKDRFNRMSELSTEIDAATNAAFTQMMWLPYLNQLENAAMSFGGNPEFLKIISSMLPSYPNGMPDMSHMMGANQRVPFPAPQFNMQPHMNYNPIELNMWQEAMMQANMQRNKTQYEMLSKHKDYREFSERLSIANATKNHSNMMAMHGNKNNSVPNFSNPQLHNPFLNMPSQYQAPVGVVSRPNLQIPQYNPSPHVPPQKQGRAPKSASNKNHTAYEAYAKNYQQKMYEEKLMKQHQISLNGHENAQPHKHTNSHENRQTNGHDLQLSSRQQANLESLQQNSQQSRYLNNYENMQHRQPNYHQQSKQVTETTKPKVVCKSFANLANNNNAHAELMKKLSYASGGGLTVSGILTGGAIDLSGSTTNVAPASGSKLKVKQHLIDPSRLMKHTDDVPEVGSTTASIEEMQDAQKHLWHPLFGNQKSYASPWNWTTVTASGE